MNRSEQYYKSVDALVKAYMNDTLKPMDCMACACGNIVAHSSGHDVKTSPDMGVMWVDTMGNILTRLPENYNWSDFRDYISGEMLGYTPKEIRGIEDAFMYGQSRKYGTDYSCSTGEKYSIFQALMDTVEYLGKIHEVDVEETEKSKQLFVKL